MFFARTLFSSLLVLLSILPCLDRSAAHSEQTAQASSELRSAVRVVQRAEQSEADMATNISSQLNWDRSPMLKDLRKAAQEIDSYLVKHPDDVPALLLAARIGRAMAVFDTAETPPGNTEEQINAAMERRERERNDRFQGYCDRVLSLDPRNAEAYYWKARLYGITVYRFGEFEIVRKPLDLDQAIRMAQRSVELAPDKLAGREALASFLVLANRDQDAMAAIQPAANEKLLIYLLLKDRLAIPVPPGAAPVPQMSMQLPLYRYPHLRAQLLVAPMSAEEIQAFWRRTWPDFRLLEHTAVVESIAKKRGGERIALFRQWMRWKDGQLHPARNAEEMPAGWPDEGLMIILEESHSKPTDEINDIKIPIPVGEVFCYIYITNFRPDASPPKEHDQTYR